MLWGRCFLSRRLGASGQRHVLISLFVVHCRLRTFCEAARERHGARQQDGEDAQREEREAEAAGEVDFEGCADVNMDRFQRLVETSVLVASRTSGESNVTIIVGLAMRGAAWVAGTLLAQATRAIGSSAHTHPGSGAVAVEVEDLCRKLSLSL